MVIIQTNKKGRDMRWILGAVVAVVLCVPNVVSAQWTPEFDSVVHRAAEDAWFAGLISEAEYDSATAFKTYLNTCAPFAVALEILHTGNATSAELAAANGYVIDFDAEKALGDADYAAGVADRAVAISTWNTGWQWALAGTTTGNSVAVVAFAASYARSEAAAANFRSASDHYDQCFMNQTALVLLRSEVQARAGTIILP